MLSGNLCLVEDLVLRDNVIKATLHWNAEHAIFAGHFPDQPVVPGVCMMQLVQECLSGATGKQWQLSSASMIKFLHFIDPRVHQAVSLQVQLPAEQSESLKITASLFNESTVFFKYNAAYRQISV